MLSSERPSMKIITFLGSVLIMISLRFCRWKPISALWWTNHKTTSDISVVFLCRNPLVQSSCFIYKYQYICSKITVQCVHYIIFHWLLYEVLFTSAFSDVLVCCYLHMYYCNLCCICFVACNNTYSSAAPFRYSTYPVYSYFFQFSFFRLVVPYIELLLHLQSYLSLSLCNHRFM